MLRKLLDLSWFKKILRWGWAHKKTSVVVIVILIVVIYLVFPKGNQVILTERVVKGDIVKTVSVTGDIDSENSVNLSFQTSGTLDYLGVKLGDHVKKYQTIASLNKDDLWANFRQAQQDFTAAKAASDQYYDSHKNATESYDEKVQRTALDATQNKAYDQMIKAQKAINNFSLYSPIEGILTRADVSTAGVNVTPATVFTITDPSSLNFKMEVDEADIGQIKVDQNVNVSLDSFPDKNIRLKVTKIDFVSHKSSSGGNTFYVKAMVSANNSYRVGMGGNADIIIDKRNNVISIPSSSVFNNNYVYVKNDDKFIKRSVSLGLQSDIDAQVISGLSEGESVALDPNSVPQNKIVK